MENRRMRSVAPRIGGVTDTKRHKNERVKNWVYEVQEVGYSIEDLIEKILAEVSGGRQEGLRNILKRIGKMPMKPFVKHKVGSEIDKIHKRLREIKENKEMYGIGGLEETSSGASVEQPIRPFVHLDIDETEVVGFELERKAIVNQLIDTKITRRSVISIVGAGGSGKTTLAKEVYKSVEVKRHFDMSKWLTISQDYKLVDILMKLLKEIGSERKNDEEEYLITELNKCMREKKYLVVLDDVWSSNNVWTQLQAALPNANNGSRVLITTRFNEIAEVADIISKPYQIMPLNEEESKQLFLKKVFPNQFANECPNDLLPLATEFIKKCRGWPLPLVVLGGILSRKNSNYITWDEVMQNMDWQTDGSNFMSVISTSYEDLPTALKPCFMYFGVFPEDYQIKATTLIRLWIAEGFICQEGTKVLEDIAYNYLEELVQRFFKRSPLTYMKNLQTVSTWFCKSHGELPLSFWGNKQLRHVNLECCYMCKATPEGPPSGADLQSLQTLRGVRARQDWVSQLPNIPNIRKLQIIIPEDVAHEPLINLLSNLNHLSSLNLVMTMDNTLTFPDCISTFRNHNRLHSFTLWWGKWPKKEVGNCTMFPPHLVKLILWEIEFEDDPMPQLEKVPNLRVLNLWFSSMKAADGKQMICSRGGFGRLQRLVLHADDLEEWKIEEGAIPILNQLKLFCKKLQIVPHLQYLVNLQELTVDASGEVKSRLNGEDQWKIKHIPSVKILKLS